MRAGGCCTAGKKGITHASVSKIVNGKPLPGVHRWSRNRPDDALRLSVGTKPGQVIFYGLRLSFFCKRGPANIFYEFINLFDHALARLLPEQIMIPLTTSVSRNNILLSSVASLEAFN